MNKNGIAAIGDRLFLSMPEMGCEGIAQVKNIIPFYFNKTCSAENEEEDYELQPITGIFEHTSNDVWKLIFDNGDTLGVTGNHPIYSEDADDWRLAGELEIGEMVLGRFGNSSVVEKFKVDWTQQIFNLEIREKHNFLVEKYGLLVHNSCYDEIVELYQKNGRVFKLPAPNKRIIPPTNPDKHWFEIDVIIDGQAVKIPYDKNGFPDFSNPNWYPGSNYRYRPANGLFGDNTGNLDFGPAYQHLKMLYPGKVTNKTGGAFDLEINGVVKRYTWHHHQDGKTMIPVLQKVHSKANPHPGGASLSKIEGGAYIDLFDSID